MKLPLGIAGVPPAVFPALRAGWPKAGLRPGSSGSMSIDICRYHRCYRLRRQISRELVPLIYWIAGVPPAAFPALRAGLARAAPGSAGCQPVSLELPELETQANSRLFEI